MHAGLRIPGDKVRMWGSGKLTLTDDLLKSHAVAAVVASIRCVGVCV